LIQTEDLKKLIAAMPKVELHVHLEGSIRPETLQQLARRHPEIPTDLPVWDLEALRQWFKFKDFPQFAKAFNSVQSFVRTPDDFELIVYEFGREMMIQNILYSEVTIAPFTHTHIFDKGLTLANILQGLEEGRRRAREDFGVEMRWIFGFARGFCVMKNGGHDLTPAETTLAYAVARKDQGVIGLTVGGDESVCPPGIFGPLFRAARQENLLSLPHAGETATRDGADFVRTAVLELEADRIGHGVDAIWDDSVLALLREREVSLDVNLTSNTVLLYPDIRQHPFLRLKDARVTLTVNSDDPALFNTTLNREYELLAEVFEYQAIEIAHLARNAFSVCGAPVDLKYKLLAEFDQWKADHLGD
jgi:aminodeoxyfutalosine deaminase